MIRLSLIGISIFAAMVTGQAPKQPGPDDFVNLLDEEFPPIEIVRECLEHFNGTMRDAASARLGMFSPDNPNPACLFECFIKKGYFLPENDTDDIEDQKVFNAEPPRRVAETVKEICAETIGRVKVPPECKKDPRRPIADCLLYIITVILHPGRWEEKGRWHYLYQVEPGTEEIRRVMQECLIQTNIRSQEEIEFIRTRTMPTTQQGMCFLGCLMEGYGYLIDGEFTEESCEAFAIQQGQTRETAAALFNLCHSKVGDGDDRCETGPRLWKCFADAHTNN